MRLLRVIILLLLAGFIALAVYAYVGDMTADPQPMRVPVQLDLGQPVPAQPATDALATDAPAADRPPAADTGDDATDAAPAQDGDGDAALD